MNMDWGMDKVTEYANAIDRERQRIGWTPSEASQFLLKHFNKQSRWILTDEELVQALELFRGEEAVVLSNQGTAQG